MFSSCIVSGFFNLTSGNRVLIRNHYNVVPNQTPTLNGTHYAFYDSLITCGDDSFASAVIRVPCPLSDVVRPDGTVAYIIGSAFIQTGEKTTLIDATRVTYIPAEASSFFPPVSAFFAAHFDCLGSVCGEPYILKDRFIVFPIAISVFVHNEMRSFQIMSEQTHPPFVFRRSADSTLFFF
jgi:hypothetical protein